ncbi:MAG: 2,3-bisphosphoglycerate-independent phosphoglycerate mutase [Thermoplasmatota archaeon]
MAPVRPALLVVIDGFGLRESREGNAIKAAKTPTLDALFASRPWTALATSGEAVGLPDGQMGNSEVGHMNIGAGRVIYQMLTRIDKAIRDGEFAKNATLAALLDHAAGRGESAEPEPGSRASNWASEGGDVGAPQRRLHLMGLLSDGGVHSSQAHLHAVLALAKARGVADVAVHVFTDGRDTSPTGGREYVAALETEMERLGVGRVATVSGRYYAMDRDARWDRTRRAWDAIVDAQGRSAASARGALEASYAAGVTDEFVEPTVIGEGAPVRDGDSVFFFNFRPDRARQLARAFAEPTFNEFSRPRTEPEAHPRQALAPEASVRSAVRTQAKPESESAEIRRPRVLFASMTRYKEEWTWDPFAFADERPTKTLGELVAALGLAQMRIAETEKYAHVTYFFNGGEEKPFPREERVLVPSPKDVATYDKKPEMSAAGVTDAAVDALRSGRFALIVMNYANCDMVGHSGDIPATVRAVETVDASLARLVAAARDAGFETFITADHGNAEEMTNPDGSPQTAHTTLPVPLIYATGARANATLARGILADVAPTLLDAMGIAKPAAMTGRSLFGS